VRGRARARASQPIRETSLNQNNNNTNKQTNTNTNKPTQTQTNQRNNPPQKQQIVEQTKEIQATTLAALRDQGRQMQNVSAGMDRLGSDLSYSERMLKFMRRCCCVGLFCGCCFEPSGKVEEDREWRHGGAGGGGGNGEEGAPPTTYKIAPPPPAVLALQQREARERAEAAKAAKKRGGAAGAAAGAAGAAGAAAGAYRGPSGSGLAAAGLDEHAATVADETATQNDYLDQISAGLDHLKQGAVAMNTELRRQEAHATEMADDATVLHARLQSVNRQAFRGI
jgi:hypothetical protein